MSRLPDSLAAIAEAPMVVPLPSDGSEVMRYKPSMSGPSSGGLIARYQVTITSTPGAVSGFAMASYQTTKEAAAAVAADGLGLSFPTSSTSVAIGSDIVAHAGRIGSEDVLAWQEGQWKVVVGEANNLPMTDAEIMAAYLHTHFLPAPQPVGTGRGTIQVMVENHGINADVVWQENRSLYQVRTYPAAQDGVLAALSMAVNMQKY
ncbi:hypothetical protein [Sulfobacillus harzensis]|uniref:Uncharacterized protein n=1 Tax=Sulfobacillus harzensis TaxID=2729629 RepID=A0A7Y0L529_9FIRM|nr:hypothetical protein [Sulfobacillus harzensis]NMP23468.1 hypothetical protein [Sulfobacillus harzensis]